AKERKRLNEIARAEARIAEIDDELAEIDGSLALEEVYTNPSKLAELSGRRKELAEEQEKLYELWESLENTD
ncbi:MAG: ABC transporter ATP-binding protein, partial [Butyrivibrio sp.]|nr:ABC transporter ATP-binding protein [Butyrivibrio sp.]